MSSLYTFKLATTDQEIHSYFALRKAIFVEEQGLFQHHDSDDYDPISYPIIAVETQTHAIIGIVRIYEPEPGLWYGGRLGVHPDYRCMGQIGKGLIHKAVTTANTWGCQCFLATVQQQNVRFFRRLHWDPIQAVTICNRPHYLMKADLTYYPAGHETRPQFSQGYPCLPA